MSRKQVYDKWVKHNGWWTYHHMHGNFEIILEIYLETFYNEYQVTLGLKWRDKMIANVDNECKTIGTATNLAGAKELAIKTLNEFVEDLK